MRRLRSLSLLISLCLGMTLVAMLSSPSQAAPLPGIPCVVPVQSDHPKVYRGRDTTPVRERDILALGEVAKSSPLARKSATTLKSTVYVPVHVKVIHGIHDGERGFGTTPKVERLVRQLNYGFSGGQSEANTDTRYRFLLRRIDWVRNERWHHAALFDAADRQAKQAMHTGNERTLNLYINGGETGGDDVLGWARFPWQQAAAPALDSVSVNHAAMTGGSATGYNRGDTVIHETGHWLGLFHTFQNECDRKNDQVVDTPAEAEPSYTCRRTRDTCKAPGTDPVTNFMNYSYDTCMNQLTAGQVRRVDAAWIRWRM